jgi:hypothetical protein
MRWCSGAVVHLCIRALEREKGVNLQGHLPVLLMNKLLLLVFLLFASFTGLAQHSSVVLFSEQGEKFSVVLNGILQNAVPSASIQVNDLKATSYKLKVLFEDQKLPPIDKDLLFQAGDESTFCIKKNSKGIYVVRFMSAVPLAEAAPPPPQREVIIYTTVPATSTTVVQTQIVSTTVTTSTTGDHGTGVSISGDGITATMITTEPIQHGANAPMHECTNAPMHHETTAPPHHRTTAPPVYVMPGYSGPVGCPYPMTDLDFRDVKATIAAKSFDDTKLEIAKQVTSANCLFASEVKEIMQLFSFESTRLEYAKFAYRFTFDMGNYYKLNDALEFESSVKELTEFTAMRDGR